MQTVLSLIYVVLQVIEIILIWTKFNILLVGSDTSIDLTEVSSYDEIDVCSTTTVSISKLSLTSNFVVLSVKSDKSINLDFSVCYFFINY